MDKNNYLHRTSRLMKNNNRTLKRIIPLLASLYGKDRAQKIAQEARHEFKDLIPHIPYIGENNPFMAFLLPTVKILSLYRVMQKHGFTLEAYPDFVNSIAGAELSAIPRPARPIVTGLMFSRWTARRLKKRARLTQQRTHPGNFVFHYIEGDGRSFDFGIDYTECANLKFLRDRGAPELLPYICRTDKIASELLGWGLKRTMTLAGGHEKCDFRFTRGGETRVSGA